MTDNPSGSTGQNVTTPPNAPEAGSNGEQERRDLEKLLSLFTGNFQAAAVAVLHTGFTRAHHHDGETVADLEEQYGADQRRIVRLCADLDAAIRERDEARAKAFAADGRRDSVECWHCLGSGSYSFDLIGDGEGGESTRCFACDGMGRLDLDAVRKLVDDEDRDHQDTKTALLKTMEERDAALRMADRWQQACTEAQRERDWWRRDTEKVAAERDEARAHHDAIRGASLADTERLIAAAETAGVQYVGCDTPDALADTVLALRAERDALAAKCNRLAKALAAVAEARDKARDLASRCNDVASNATKAAIEANGEAASAEAKLAEALKAKNENGWNGIAAAGAAVVAEQRAAALADALRQIATTPDAHSCGGEDMVEAHNLGVERMRAIARAALAGNGNGNGTGEG